MINTNNPNQLSFFDPFDNLGSKRKKLLENSWAYFFRHHVLAEIPVKKVSRCFSEYYGRPTKELYSSLGTLLLQQTFDLTDKETLSELAFNLQWHYALNITDSDDDCAYMCDKTLYNIRNILLSNNLWGVLFNDITDSLIREFNLNTDKQRLDSTHIKSNMKALGRISIFSQTLHKFLTNLKRQNRILFDQIPKNLVEKYLKNKALAAFSMVKPSESQKTLKSLSADLYHLLQRFENSSNVAQMKSYALLKRVFNEQCEIVNKNLEGKTEISIEAKSSKEIACDSLQNPSDPDATYDGHKGKGYQVQVMETCTENKAETTPNLITYVKVEPAHNHDSKSLIPAIASTEKRKIKPTEILADSLYGNDENTQQAKSKDVAIISPTLEGATKKDTLHLNAFSFNARNQMTCCPNGKIPLSHHQSKKKDAFIAKFKLADCKACPLRSKCPVKDAKNNTFIRYTTKDIRLAERRNYEKSHDFISKYALRAGVEATMSEYKKITGVGNLRVRGLKAVSYSATLKALGINILRSTRAFMTQNNPIEPIVDSLNTKLTIFLLNLNKIFKILPKSVSNFYKNEISNYIFIKTTDSNKIIVFSNY